MAGLPPPGYDAPPSSVYSAPVIAQSYQPGQVYTAPPACVPNGAGMSKGDTPPVLTAYVPLDARMASGKDEFFKENIMCFACTSPLKWCMSIPCFLCFHHSTRFEILSRLGREYECLNGALRHCCCGMCNSCQEMFDSCPAFSMCLELMCCHSCAVEVNRELIGEHYDLRLRCCADCYCGASSTEDSGGNSGGDDSLGGVIFGCLVGLLLTGVCSGCYAGQARLELEYQDEGGWAGRQARKAGGKSSSNYDAVPPNQSPHDAPLPPQ